MAQLPVTIWTASLQPEAPWRLPRAPGAVVRSALLAALFHGVCLRPDGECDPCPHQQRCPIPGFWHAAGHRVPRWWLSVQPGAGEVVGPDRPLVVQIGVAGALPRPTALVEALLRMAAMGLGQHRVVHHLEVLHASGEGSPVVVVRHGESVGVVPAPSPLSRHVAPPRDPGPARIQLRTPFVSRRPPTAASWLGTAIGRIRGLARAADVRLPVRWPSPEGIASGGGRLERVEADRRSNSHRGRHPLSGWVGYLDLPAATAAPFVDLIAAAEVVGVGRSTTSGLGSVEVCWEQPWPSGHRHPTDLHDDRTPQVPGFPSQ